MNSNNQVIQTIALIVLLNAILAKHAHTRVNGKVSSERSITAAGEALRSCFRLLIELGYKLEKPENISNKHIVALCRAWYHKGLSPKTMQSYLSHLRIFCRWIGKPGLVKNINAYLTDVDAAKLRVKTNAEKSKSWAEQGIDVVEKVHDAMLLDRRFGLMIMVQVSFGLRRMEVLQMKPWKCDEGDKFYVYRTKGQRPRYVPIETEHQRAVLDVVKSYLNKNEALGWREREDGKAATLAFSTSRYSRLMRKIGITKEHSAVTGHGLRAQYAENAALLRDFVPPTLGGSTGQFDKAEMSLKRSKVSENLGHSRISITGAYYGSFGRNATLDGPDRAKINIEKALTALSRQDLPRIPDERRADCVRLVSEIMQIGILDDPHKIQVLWERHSRRHGTEWLTPPEVSCIAALEESALSYIRENGNGDEAQA
jgi:integrase